MKTLKEYFGLNGKVAVITGGAGFLGLKHAEAIIDAGGVPILLDINTERLMEAKSQLNSLYPDKAVEVITTDITSERDIKSAYEKIIDKYSRIDILINNAANNPQVSREMGLKESLQFEYFTLEKWNKDFSVGLTGAFLCSKVFGTHMANKGKGIIVNISSDLSIISPDQRLYRREGIPEEEQDIKPVSYSSVKTAILGLTRYLSTYWANKNVRVNTLVLGGVLKDQDSEFLKRVESRIPLGRLANPDEYSGTLIYMCSESSSYMTGATLVIDGGRTIW
ncbi:SDR family oxidoreductase [Bacillus pseudomycoides]|uniref:SDR family oxidoreductase n=1 Tax=Bacillus TaxID=1386 RepID=UPI000375CEF3|nr:MULTISPECIES: SDR family oxidoreductase [Bacillus]MCX2829469.1 SDR family oxidoreductase [Bacillus sp. DHT2]MDR4916742.1 SDR family oxidoreductase [Bacillus pseudomycoides]PEK39643.1 SDR family oxidoreductase [Bacillus pseudomycoides]PEK66394.1 SDR family oxidoreductase [Bacillus pseudomycoides]PEP38736.1 SDR family oxidoreductase [Bacillus pseudomycoides]